MLTFALSLLLACPESPPDGVGSGSASSGAGASVAASSDPAAGDQGEQLEGAPGAVPPSGMPPSGASFSVTDGEGVRLSGTIRYGGEVEGEVRLDVLTLSGDGPPSLVHTEPLNRPGDFALEAPADFGEIHLVAFLDVAGDGPSPTDPAGLLTLTVGGEDREDLELEIVDEADLGALTPMLPGIPGAEGASGVAPPPEQEPTEEGEPPEAVDPPPEGAPEVAPEAVDPPPEGAAPPTEGVEPPPEGDGGE